MRAKKMFRIDDFLILSLQPSLLPGVIPHLSQRKLKKPSEINMDGK